MKNITKSSCVLMSDPTYSTHEVKYVRADTAYKNCCQKFLHKKKDFSRQFFHIYAVRLAKMKDTIRLKALNRWGDDISIKRLADLQDDSGERCIIVGTLFKHQELKPSILKEISEELIPQQKQTRFFSDSDELILEDELQRIKLIGNIDIQSAVTGIVCATLGKQDESGKFIVEDICWAGSKHIPAPFRPLSTDRFVLLVSGLDFSHNADLLPVRFLLDYTTGWLGDPDFQNETSKICQVIIAGGIIRRNRPEKDGKVVKTEVGSSSDLSTTLEQVDEFLRELAESVDVDIMPGEFDPTNYQLPQQPIHLAMFQKASKLKSLRSVTNPYEASIEGRLFVGSSGQPVEDVARYAATDKQIDVLEATLRWGHLAPTAPDTLACYPYYEDDPFIIECQPDIYFAGNQESFSTKLIEIDRGRSLTSLQGGFDNIFVIVNIVISMSDEGDDETHLTRLICVPSFAETCTCALININTLDCQPVEFKMKSLVSEL